MSDEVGQLQWSHSETTEGPHRLVYEIRGRQTILHASERLEVIGASDSIDDEPRCVRCASDMLVPAGCDRRNTVNNGGVRFPSPDNFDQLHDRRRIEEVHAGDPIRTAQFVPQFGDGQ